ncbi:hypothetical protein J437_LFUL012058 [Ladona fulva]|uniref:Uncharacterized protein n=1 Tax=Ladona fulva TaxID=123851 RepID=A0A8K0KD84_LADFU|nr:hypothetical protein J437_LFUL012058 [Ladona fulva]
MGITNWFICHFISELQEGRFFPPRDILARNGSAVDAAVAAMLCNGVVNCQSMGLGGGFFMVAYSRSRKVSYSLDARETAPAATNAALYDGKPNASKKGELKCRLDCARYGILSSLLIVIFWS